MTVFSFGLFAALTATSAAPLDGTTENRAAVIDRVLAEDARSSRLWYAGWGAFYTVATGFSMKVVLDSDDRDRRVGSAVDGIRSGLGLVTTLLFVPPSLATPRFADGDVASREQWLEKAADAERLGRSVLSHVANAAVNAAGGGYLWLHEHRFTAGLIAFLSGTLIGEIKIWTQPTRALDEVQAGKTAKATAMQIAIVPTASTTFAGLALDARF